MQPLAMVFDAAIAMVSPIYGNGLHSGSKSRDYPLLRLNQAPHAVAVKKPTKTKPIAASYQ
jgi:hypothetical protein